MKNAFSIGIDQANNIINKAPALGTSQPVEPIGMYV